LGVGGDGGKKGIEILPVNAVGGVVAGVWTWVGLDFYLRNGDRSHEHENEGEEQKGFEIAHL